MGAVNARDARVHGASTLVEWRNFRVCPGVAGRIGLDLVGFAERFRERVRFGFGGTVAQRAVARRVAWRIVGGVGNARKQRAACAHCVSFSGVIQVTRSGGWPGGSGWAGEFGRGGSLWSVGNACSQRAECAHWVPFNGVILGGGPVRGDRGSRGLGLGLRHRTGALGGRMGVRRSEALPVAGGRGSEGAGSRVAVWAWKGSGGRGG